MRLSICIPTYNRAHTLQVLLDEVATQVELSGLSANIEIVVCDNASSDDTAAVIARFGNTGLKLTYFQQPSNLGFGRNLNQAVSLATGDYCWLMGSDDVPAPGALAEVLARVGEGPDVIIGNVLTNGNLRTLVDGPAGRQHIQDAASIEAFLGRCTEISALFAFMSSLVVRREYWNSVAATQELVMHPYTHQLRIFTAMVKQGMRLHTLQEPIVVTGAEGNEWDAVISKHFELDCRTLALITETILPRAVRASALGAVFKRQYGLVKLISARSGMDDAAWTRIAPTLRSWGYESVWLKKRPYDSVLFWLYKRAKQLRGLGK